MEYAVEMNRLIELQMEGSHWLTSPRPSSLTLDAPAGGGRPAVVRRAARLQRTSRAGSSRRSTSSTSTPSPPAPGGAAEQLLFELGDAVDGLRRAGGVRGPARACRSRGGRAAPRARRAPPRHASCTQRHAVHRAQRRALDRRHASSTSRATCTSRRRSLLTTVHEQAGTSLHQRTLVVLEEGAEAEVWDAVAVRRRRRRGPRQRRRRARRRRRTRACATSARQALDEKTWVFGAQRAMVERDG